MQSEHSEIQKALSQEEPEVTARDFKAIGVILPTKYPWQELALSIIKEFNITDPKIKPWIFNLCRTKPLAKENFEKSKGKNIRYFLACFRSIKHDEKL